MARFKPTRFMAEDSKYNKKAADYAVSFIECLSHTKGTWAGKKFELLDWQEQIIRDLFGILKPNGYRQFNTAYIEIPKKQGKSELAAAVALLLCCGDGEERAEVYGCAADRQQASIVFEVAADMVRMCPALNKRVKILASQKRIIFQPTNSFYQVLSAEAYSKHGFNIHGVVFDELHTQPNRKLFDVMTKGSGAAAENTVAYINAMKHPAVKVLGHCDDPHFPVDYRTLAIAALQENVIFEINEASLSPNGYRGDTTSNATEILYFCQKYEIPIILSSDSHGKDHVGDFTYSAEFVHQAMFPESLILNNQIPKLKFFLQTR